MSTYSHFNPLSSGFLVTSRANLKVYAYFRIQSRRRFSPPIPRAPHTRLPADVRRQQIAVAARNVFAVHGLAGSKTRQIAEAAKVTEAVLYRFFRSKNEIFQFAILEPVEKLSTDLVRLTAEFSRTDAKRRLELSHQIQQEIFEVVQEITPLLGVALFSDRDAGGEFYNERLVPLIELSTAAIGKAMARRQRKAMSPDVMYLVLFGMYFGVSLDALFDGGGGSHDGVAAQLTNLVAFGLFGVPEAVP